jgi:ATP-dependent DNA ligase
MLQRVYRPVPAIPRRATTNGPQWIHEIKHDGYRMMAHGLFRDAIGDAMCP